jgi:hypothetical protein
MVNGGRQPETPFFLVMGRKLSHAPFARPRRMGTSGSVKGQIDFSQARARAYTDHWASGILGNCREPHAREPTIMKSLNVARTELGQPEAHPNEVIDQDSFQNNP